MIIMDVAMPDLNGLEAMRQILSNNPHIKVIALSMHADKRYVTGCFLPGHRDTSSNIARSRSLCMPFVLSFPIRFI